MKSREGGEDAWQPARDTHGITVSAVLDALDRCGAVEPAFAQADDFRAISDTLDEFGKTVDASPANRPLLDL